jgi:aldehyde:ferredoxin oxidoreductase
MCKYGFHNKILHVDLKNKNIKIESPPDGFFRKYMGGGLLATYYLLKMTPKGIDPLSPHNKLIFVSSAIAGHKAPGLARFTVVAKSPLTGGIGESRCEGPWGIALKSAGIDGVICHNSSDVPVILVINNGAAEIIEAKNLWGENVNKTTDLLEMQFGSDVHVATIGPAGENLVRFATIISDRCHQAGRMGLGAVMGSKNLKAIVVKRGKTPPVADPEGLKKIHKFFNNQIQKNQLSKWQADPPGFSAWIHTHGIDASLCVNNYQSATCNYTEKYKPENFMKYFNGVHPCPGCPNDCIKSFHTDDKLDKRAGGIHQEITGSMGPNIGLMDIEIILKANKLANEWGIDPNSLGFTISFAMECLEKGLLNDKDFGGLSLSFGNGEAVLKLIKKITYRNGIGNILAEGSKRAAIEIGKGSEKYALTVKGNEIVPFEPRSQTNLALGYATSPTGPRYEICEHDWDFDTKVGWDHTLKYSKTLGILKRIPMEYLGPDKVRNYKVLNNLWSAADALNLCIFAVAPTRILSLEHMSDIVRMITGWETSSYEVMRWGERRNHIMRVYNNREGFSPENDILPDRFFEEPIDSGPHKGISLNRLAFKEAVSIYYQMMGWDKNGQPLPATLYDYGLEWIIDKAVKY